MKVGAMSDWIETIKLHAAVQTASLGQARHGIVTSVDPVAHAVKVTVQPEGLETGWIPDGAMAASGLRIACPSEIGTQVLILPVEGDAEHPIVVARLFDVTLVAPVSPATGRQVQPREIGIFQSNGNYLHLAKDGLYLKGDLSVDGSVLVGGDVTASGVSLVRHVHGGVQPGSGLTGQPKPADV
jgi:phage baseplate assembly protein gpV